MTTVTAPGPGPVLGPYLERMRAAGAPDELVREGSVRPAWEQVAGAAESLGVEGLLACGEEGRRLLEDDGVSYLVSGEESAQPRRWVLDPLPVVLGEDEWAGLSRALIQRAELLDLVLGDIYGHRRLVRSGLLPAELVMGHEEYVRAADGVRLPGPRQLFLAAHDLARDADGAWRVLGDRTQAPSGLGFAMEDRRVVSRVVPDLYRSTRMLRLSPFFQTLRVALQAVAPQESDTPRVVLLTPGTHSETAFDQAFLATLLGYPLVEGSDLTVREGRVWLRALGRLEPVDVILRRVDSSWCDPLEMRPGSQLGVPGLLEAARRGTVSVVNTVGSGVLENPGLLPFLPALAKTLLDTELLLPAVDTFWCGEPAARQHVLAHLDRMVLRPLSRGQGRSRFGELHDVGRACRAGRTHRGGAGAVGRPGPAGAEHRAHGDAGGAVTASVRAAHLRGVGGRGVPDDAGRPRARGSDPGSPAGHQQRRGDRQGRLGARRATYGPRPGSTRGLRSSPCDRRPTSHRASPRTCIWFGRYAERAEGVVRLLRTAADRSNDFQRGRGPCGRRVPACPARGPHPSDDDLSRASSVRGSRGGPR